MDIQLSERSKKLEMSPIREIFAMASKTKGLTRFEAGQPDFSTPQHIIDEANKTFNEGIMGYTPSDGLPITKNAVSFRYKEDYGLEFNPDNEIAITNGASGALYLILRSIINVGDEVLRPDPGWPQYDSMIIDADGIPVLYPTIPDKGFKIDIDRLEGLVNSKTKAIIVNSPSNPTGHVMEKEELEGICKFAEKHDLYIISDEAYDKIIYRKEHIPTKKVAKNNDKVITIGSASKNYAMCGWRIGFVAANSSIISEVVKFQSLSNICPSLISQTAYAKALTSHQEDTDFMKQEYMKRADYFIEEINSIKGFKCYKPEGAFYAFVDVSEITTDDWAFSKKLIEEAKVTCIPGSSFGNVGKGFIRFSYATSMEDLKEGIEKLKAVFNN